MSQVFPVNFTTKKPSNDANEAFSKTPIPEVIIDESINSNGKSLGQEWMDHKDFAERRSKLFEDIINNRASEHEKADYKGVMKPLIGGMLFSYFVLCFLTELRFYCYKNKLFVSIHQNLGFLVVFLFDKSRFVVYH